MLLKIILSVVLLAIAFQDIKSRLVYTFLFPIILIIGGYLHYSNSFKEMFIEYSMINFAIVSIMILVIAIYSYFRLQLNLFNAFGKGDLALFIALVFCFPTLTFVVLFVFSLIFSLGIHLIIKRKSKQLTVPLAGYMSLFFLLVYNCYWFGFYNALYQY